MPIDLLNHRRRHSIVKDGKVDCYSHFVVADLGPYLAFTLSR